MSHVNPADEIRERALAAQTAGVENLKQWFKHSGLHHLDEWANTSGDTMWSCWECPCNHVVQFESVAFISRDAFRSRLVPPDTDPHACPCHTLPYSIPLPPRSVLWTVSDPGKEEFGERSVWLTFTPRDTMTGKPVTCRCGGEAVVYILPDPSWASTQAVLSEEFVAQSYPWHRWFCASCLGMPQDLDVAAQLWITNPDDPAGEPRQLIEARETLESALALGWIPSIMIAADE